MAEKLMQKVELEELEEEEEEVEDQLEDWDDWNSDEEDSDRGFICLFCNMKYSSTETLFEHCSSTHHFNFQIIRESLGLDFYGCFKLINYVRSQVAENRCWTCGLTCQSNKDLLNHLHEPVSLGDSKNFWQDDKYLKPYMQEDSLLHSFAEDEDGEDDCTISVDREELMKELGITLDFENICIDDGNTFDLVCSKPDTNDENVRKDSSPASSSLFNVGDQLEKAMVDLIETKDNIGFTHKRQEDKHKRLQFAEPVAKKIKNANENYFGSYSSFGIHREMISDKVRMDAYMGAILNNPSLLNGATILDVGCGTGILSLFAAQAGASRVISVEASHKMASVATQVAKDNGLLWNGSFTGGNNQCTGVINVVQGMIEELDESLNIPPNSADVLLSEWMGYCLLYESMLSSVLYARDRWLKPGGAILPDTATIFVAGFGRGGTSIPFWENVYGFNMSCIGKEVAQDAAQLPVVDVVDSHDIVTNAVVLQSFDLVNMKPQEMDFNASVELEPKSGHPGDNHTDLQPKITWCYGVVLWFETGFTSRFCKEMPTVLSTSPYSPETHWYQTIFTFREPIAMASGKPECNGMAEIGTETCPAMKIQSRISIVRAEQHRCVDISLETVGICCDGRKRSWPVQIFKL